MRLIIAGTRTLEVNNEFITQCLRMTDIDKGITSVVCGMAPGMDECGRQWAISKKIPVDEFPADWKGLSKSAGMVRNKQMADNGDALLLIWTGDEKKSPGSAGMKALMLKQNKPIYEVILKAYNT